MSIDKPDWGRYQVESRAGDTTGKTHTALGDPTQWGNTAVLSGITSPPALFRFDDSPQFLRAQCQPPYSRLWALTGVATAPPAMWALAAADWLLFLEITLGVGQTSITQLFDLRKLTTLALATAYGTLPNSAVGEGRPFAIVGGVIGNSWSARVRSALATATGILDAEVSVGVISTPVAAGEGL